MLLSNNTFLLVKASFTKPAVILQSSIKLEQLVDLVKRMSMNELSNQTNAEISEQPIISGGYGNIGAEGIKLMELHVCAPGEEANDKTKEVRSSVSRTRKTRQLTEKGKQYQMNLLLDKRTQTVARLQDCRLVERFCR